jgi:hypothetical protein
MIYEAKLITAGETAHFLQKHLGSLRQWRDFLSDNIRYKQNIEGLTLLPRAKLQGPTGYGPAYIIGDVLAFIRAVKAAVPSAGKPITPVNVQLDTCRAWRVSRFDRKGNPVARHRSMAHACRTSRPTTI